MWRAIFVVALFVSPVWGAEQTIRTPGGAYVGKYEYDTIDPADALISPIGEVTTAYAGFIANNQYREVQIFKDGFLGFEKVEPPYFWYETSFTEENAKKIVFQGKNYQFRAAEKIGRRVIFVYGAKQELPCAGVVYAGASRPFHDIGALNDWYATTVYCANKPDEELLKIAKERLEGARRDGKRLVPNL